jgi:hypothetical protein
MNAAAMTDRTTNVSLPLGTAGRVAGSSPRRRPE